jgi:putative endonuclease
MASTQAPRWKVYLLVCNDGTLYCGITTDLQHRIQDHAAGKGSKYVYSRRPFGVCALSNGNLTRSQALKEEARIKRLPKLDKYAAVNAIQGV